MNATTKEALLQRIRSLSDDERHFMTRCFAVGMVGEDDYATACEYRKHAICAFERDDFEACDSWCRLAEEKSAEEKRDFERRLSEQIRLGFVPTPARLKH